MKIVSSGRPYIDIDAYAGCIAYAELLREQGQEACAVSTSPPNESVTPTILSWQAPLVTSYVPSPDDSFIVVDLSDPAHFDLLIDPTRIERVIDHHSGFETQWQQRLGAAAEIEFIGSVCTLIYEDWLKAGLAARLSQRTACLMLAALLDNTLNFQADVTTERDRAAYRALQQLAQLPNDWPVQYFQECQTAIMADVPTAVRNDRKRLPFGAAGQEASIGQLVVWDARPVLAEHLADIKAVLIEASPRWVMNLVSVSEGRSYFISDDDEMKHELKRVLNVRFQGNLAQASRLWLRKEMIKRSKEAA